MDFDPQSLVGTTLADKYVVESVVGEGGFAVVYRATHSVWKRPVALKVFKVFADASHERREQLLADFVREGALLAELSERSSAIVQARDIGTTVLPSGDEVPFMVLEWLDGETLETVLFREAEANEPTRSIEQTVELLGPVAEALALAHQKGIAHRDVKPGNVFVVGDVSAVHTVKLLDFGIAKVVQEAQKDGFRKTSAIPSSFTPLYGAPEQFDRTVGSTGPWTDVFALALVLVEVMLGREALVGDNVTQLAFSAMDTRRRPSPRNLGVLVNDEVEKAFLKALEVKPEARFQDVGEFWVALRMALALGPPSGFTLASAQLRRVAPVSSVRGALSPSLATTPSMGAPQVVSVVGSSAGRTAPLGVVEQPVSRASTAVESSVDVRRTPVGADTSAPTTGKSKAWMGLVAVAAIGALAGAGLFFRSKANDGSANANATPSASASVPASASASAVIKPEAPACPKGMLEVKGGDFYMGSDDKSVNDDEKPAHPVKLERYCLDEFEVTVAEFKACTDSGKCKRRPPENDWKGITPRQKKLYDPVCNANDVTGMAAHPINCVDWTDAQTFCEEMRGGRLPTEAEWEFAARGSDGRIYPWGDTPPAPGLLNACGSECVAWKRKNPDPDDVLTAMYKSDDGFVHTSPVGSFPRGQTSHGMKDMVGNVWEWVSDYHAPYTQGPRVLSPKGPTSGETRVIRGGAWNGGDPSWLRPTYRFHAPPEMRSHGIGFRCAKAG